MGSAVRDSVYCIYSTYYVCALRRFYILYFWRALKQDSTGPWFVCVLQYSLLLCMMLWLGGYCQDNLNHLLLQCCPFAARCLCSISTLDAGPTRSISRGRACARVPMRKVFLAAGERVAKTQQTSLAGGRALDSLVRRCVRHHFPRGA